MTVGRSDPGLAAVLRPRSIAIVGDSPRQRSRGGAIHANLDRLGFSGPIHPVNPRYEQVRGRRCYPSLDGLPQPVDFVAVAVPAGQAVDLVRQAAHAGARAVSFVAGGFAEAGPDGRAVQDRLRAEARRFGVELVGPNCYGVASLVDGFAAYFGSLPTDLTPGSVALVSQSGGVLNTVLDAAAGRDLGFSHLITTGNEATLGVERYVAALAAAAEVRVIACYLETVRDPRAFDRALLDTRLAGRHVVVLRSGRSAAGRAAVAAHTGALATESRLLAAACRSRGAVLVDDVDELVNACELLTNAGRAPGPHSILMSISGGTCALAADVADETGVRLAELDENTQAAVGRQLPFATVPRNPLDLTGVAASDADVLPRVLATLEALPADRNLVLLLNSPTACDEEDRRLYRELARVFCAHAASSRHHCAVVASASGAVDDVVATVSHSNGVPVLVGLRPALRSLALAVGRDAFVDDDVPTRHASPWSTMSTAPTEVELKRALGRLGVAVPAGELVKDEESAAAAATRVGYPVVLKAQSPQLAHKTECGAVRVGLDAEAAVRSAYGEISSAVRMHLGEWPGAMLVEREVPPGVDVLVGVMVDAVLGPFIVCGTGGVLAELLDDVVVVRAPMTRSSVADLLRQLPVLEKRLHGVRGAPPADIEALSDLLRRISDIALGLSGEPCALDLNPVRVLPAGQGVVVLDAWLARSEERCSNLSQALDGSCRGVDHKEHSSER